MEIKRVHITGIVIAVVFLIVSVFFINTRFFLLLLGIGIITGISPVVFSLMKENRISAEKEEMFIEFARNLVESVKTGTPISKSIINVKDKSYGVLSPNIEKLANQIYMGIPMSKALQVFSRDVDNPTVSRALTLIGQAEKSGGDIGQILESVAEAVSTSDKLKKERRALISTLVVQGYIIFFVFMVIILVMQFKIIPLLSGIGSGGLGNAGVGSSAIGAADDSPLEVANAFFYMLLIQGFFSGLVIGKLSEGTIKAGVKHSFILVVLAFSVSAASNLFF
jgi:flagellar protein FlaJ